MKSPSLLKSSTLNTSKILPETTMTTSTPKPNAPSRLRYIPLAAVAALSLMPSAANAAITNDAKATGTYGAATVESATASATVTVTPAGPALTIAKSVSAGPTTSSGASATNTDAGDTITFRYVVTNTGNVTMNSVVPVEGAAGPQFNTVNGTGSFAAFSPLSATLAPGASQAFTAVYTLSAADVFRAADVTNGVTNTATATASPASGGSYTSPASNIATATITGFGALSITKARVLTDAAGGGTGTADVGETITYTYTIANTGTAAVTNVSVDDQHEGSGVAVGAGGITAETLTVNGPLGAAASTNTVANNGIWNTLAAGASITMTYTHVVTTTEFNNQ
jgi:uncharacterized cupredoxin-like copper-binding protein